MRPIAHSLALATLLFGACAEPSEIQETSGDAVPRAGTDTSAGSTAHQDGDLQADGNDVATTGATPTPTPANTAEVPDGDGSTDAGTNDAGTNDAGADGEGAEGEGDAATVTPTPTPLGPTPGAFQLTGPVPIPNDPLLPPASTGLLSDAVRPEIRWTASADALTYDVTVATDAACTTPVAAATGLTATSYVFDAYKHLVSYYVCITARNGVGAKAADNNGFTFRVHIPTLALGQPDLNSAIVNNGGVTFGMSGPSGVAIHGSTLLVSDRFNSRILILAQIQQRRNSAPTQLLGQAATDQSAPGTSQGALTLPTVPYYDGRYILIGDSNNNRVMMWNADAAGAVGPTAFVLGQPNFNSQTPATTASGYRSAHSAIVADGKVYVADSANHRLLILNEIPISNAEPADVVMGQTDMVQQAINRGTTVSAKSFYYPTQVLYAEGKFAVVDSLNNRVLLWNSLPDSDRDADVVIGQADMTKNEVTVPAAPHRLYNPYSVAICDKWLFVADRLNHRIVGWTPIPTANNVPATYVFGQSSMSDRLANAGGQGAHAGGLNQPQGVACDKNRLYIADSGNHRVLVVPRP